MVTGDDVNQSIELLDLTVFSDGEKLLTKWCHEPIASRIINYLSRHPKNMVLS